MQRLLGLCLLMICLLLSACASGPVRRVSEPAASIQQLSVRADGSWSVDVRINNFSSISMRFDTIALALSINGQDAGVLQTRPAVSIGPESADVVAIVLEPNAAARIAMADALAGNLGVQYALAGSVDAMPEAGNTRNYSIKHASALNPVPGVPGMLR